jgi:peroxiredoxin
MQTKITAGAKFPEVVVNTAGGNVINLAEPQGAADWRMVVVYRGKHCPLCTRYLTMIEERKQQFYDLGVDIAAVSADSAAQVKEHLATMSLSFPVAYGLTIEQMQSLGLYISNPRSPQETDHPFAEPGLFVINRDGNVQVVDISNGPFARPELETLVSGLEFVRNNDYPIRGTYL